jgi:heme exporter protein C
VWDARVTTTAFLFITYVGYLAVRGLGGSHEQRARRSAVVALLAVHRDPARALQREALAVGAPGRERRRSHHRRHPRRDLMLFTLLLATVAFTLLYVWYVLHRQRVMTMEDALDDKGLDLALAERRREAATNGVSNGAPSATGEVTN